MCIRDREIVDATRTWDEDFAEAVRVAHGEEVGAKLLSRYGRAFPEAYKEDFAPRVAVADLKTIDALGDQESSFNLYQEPGAPGEQRRFKLYRREELSLTRVLPIFTHLGVEVVDELSLIHI